MQQMTPAQMVGAYIRLRDAKKSAEEEFKKSMERPNAAMEKLENALLAHLDANGVNSVACDAGTVYKNIQTSASVQDQNAFLKFIMDNNLWEAMDIKANKTFVKEYMEQHGVALPGVNVTQMAKVGVRRS